MSGPGKISAKQIAAIAALLSAGNLEDAAKSCAIGVSTLRRWRQEPGFAKRYTEARDELLEFTINGLALIGMDGVMALHRVAVDLESPAAATVSAGRAILEVQLKAKEILDLTVRLAKLEEALKGEE